MATNQSHGISVSTSCKRVKPELNKFGTKKFATHSNGVKETGMTKNRVQRNRFVTFVRLIVNLTNVKGLMDLVIRQNGNSPKILSL